MAAVKHFPNITTLSTVEVDVLIVGAGPAGASLASFLCRDNVSALMVSSASGTASEPRAHYTNLAAMDAIRDLGLQGECDLVAQKGDAVSHIRWADTMAGEEYARAWMGGSKPDRLSDYASASPSKVLDLPQSLLEPILVKYASANGINVRFNSQFVRYKQRGDGRIASLVRDLLTGSEYEVVSKYLCGADGGRSVIAQQSALPMVSQPGPTAYSILVRANMNRFMANRMGSLHYCLGLDKDYPFMFLWRMVKPWHEWLLIAFPKPGRALEELPDEDWKRIVDETIGDPSISSEIVQISRWLVNETYAEQYSRDSVFCLGDAVHRHPPTGGLGSNTCIQDSFNLAWKLSLVLKGLASPRLLETYSTERQPIGEAVVKRANAALRDYGPVFNALGIMLPTPQKRKEAITQLTSSGGTGKEMRQQLRQGLLAISDREMHALGMEMAQLYSGSLAIYTSDEPESFLPKGKEAQDPVAHYTPSTYPGRRFPHAWLDQSMPGKRVSTIDLAGKGVFCLCTGPGGTAWKESAKIVSKELGVQINAYKIGFRQDWEDVYGDWARICESDGIEEDGCVLVRPDLFVAWRANISAGDVTACKKKLQAVMERMLGLGEVLFT